MTSFLVPTARAAAASNHLLTASQFERILAAPTAEESYRILVDLAWAGNSAEIPSFAESESYLFSGVFALKNLYDSSVDSEAFLKILFLPFDLQNAKASLSAFFRGEDYESIRRGLSDFSFFPKRTAFEILFEQKTTPDFFRTALLLAKKKFNESPDDFRAAEEILDAAFFAEMAENVAILNDSGISEFFSKRIAFENQKSFLRAKDRGRIPFFTGSVSDPLHFLNEKQFSARVPVAHYSAEISESEREIQILSDLFWTARLTPDAPLNLVFLFEAKRKNAEMLRILFAGKRNGLSSEEIRQMVTPFLLLLPKK